MADPDAIAAGPTVEEVTRALFFEWMRANWHGMPEEDMAFEWERRQERARAAKPYQIAREVDAYAAAVTALYAPVLAALAALEGARIQEVASAEGWLAERGYADSRPHSAVAIANLLADYAADVRAKLAAAEAALARLSSATSGLACLHDHAQPGPHSAGCRCGCRFCNAWADAHEAAVTKATHPGAP